MHDVVIIGAGPSGIALGSELIEAGINTDKVLLLEKADKSSWIMRKLYPEQKLVTANFKGLSPVCNGVMRFQDMKKDDALRVMKESIEKYNLNIDYNTNVIKVEKNGDTFEITTPGKIYHAKICIVSIGMFGKPNKPDYKIPGSIVKNTFYDITTTKIENSDVLVVGGGDSASEYVQHLIEDGNRLSISCREESFWRMNDGNRAKMHKLEADKIIHAYRESNVAKVEDENGRIKVFFEGDIGEKEYDHIVYALGGTTPMNFLKLIGVDFDGKEPILRKGNESTVDDLFIVGDLSAGKGGGSIILAFNSSYDASLKILPRLQ